MSSRKEIDVSPPTPRDDLTANRLLEVREVAVFLAISEKAVRRRIERGQLPGVVRLGPRTIRLRLADLLAWTGQGRAPSPRRTRR